MLLWENMQITFKFPVSKKEPKQVNSKFHQTQWDDKNPTGLYTTVERERTSEETVWGFCACMNRPIRPITAAVVSGGARQATAPRNINEPLQHLLNKMKIQWRKENVWCIFVALKLPLVLRPEYRVLSGHFELWTLVIQSRIFFFLTLQRRNSYFQKKLDLT